MIRVDGTANLTRRHERPRGTRGHISEFTRCSRPPFLIVHFSGLVPHPFLRDARERTLRNARPTLRCCNDCGQIGGPSSSCVVGADSRLSELVDDLLRLLLHVNETGPLPGKTSRRSPPTPGSDSAPPHGAAPGTRGGRRSDPL